MAIAAEDAVLPCEKLGPPLVARDLAIEAVTQSPEGGYVAWGRFVTADRTAAVGLPLDGGEPIWVETRSFGRGSFTLGRGADGNLYLYSGSPGHFLRYEVATGTLADLGAPASPANYWMGHCLDRQGRMLVGTYPGTAIACCDTRTGKVSSLGPVATDARQKYVTRVAADDSGLVYAAVGLHHRELWSVDPTSGAKRQILPADLTEAQGAPDVWTGTDGHVYGKTGDREFRCHPDRIEVTAVAERRQDATRLQAGPDRVLGVDEAGQLRLEDAAGAVRSVATPYAGRPVSLYSVACERGGRLWGGGLFPGLLWSYDLASGQMTNHGMVPHGAIQIYDIVSGEAGLYIASYMGCHIDRFDPDQPRKVHENPFRIAASVTGQERPNQWECGPDGKLYFGTTPAKGRLGGALVQVDPATRAWRQWPCPIPDLSLTYLAAIPETGELLACTSVAGGSSAIPLAEEAAIYLWDPAKAVMTWSGKPVPGTRTYGRALRLRDGRVFGLAEGQFYLLDPVRRAVLATGPMPASRCAFPMLNDAPVGPRGLVYGVGDGAVFAFDPTDNTVRRVGRHPSLDAAHGFLVTAPGVLYYGSGADLWRCPLPP